MLVPGSRRALRPRRRKPIKKAYTMDGLSALVEASAAAAAPAGDPPKARAPPPEVPEPKLDAPRASVTPPLGTAPVPHAVPAPAAAAATAPAAQNMAQPETVAAAPPHAAAPQPVRHSRLAGLAGEKRGLDLVVRVLLDVRRPAVLEDRLPVGAAASVCRRGRGSG